LEVGRRPAAAESFDEEDAGVHAAALDINVVAFVLESDGLGVDDLEIGIHSALVAVGEELKRFLAEVVA